MVDKRKHALEVDNNKVGNKFKKIIFIVAAAIGVILAFAVFIKGNSERAEALSVSSLKDSTAISSQRLDEILQSAQEELKLTATLYEAINNTAEVTRDDLKILTEKSPFDYIEFVPVEITQCYIL
jgi:hypothetical protein